MEAYLQFLNSFIEKNNKEYSSLKGVPKFVGYEESYIADDKRNKLLEKIGNKLSWKFGNTKPVLNNISKGCVICGEGEWSCLFITGKCNARCFYCPAKQENDHLPATQLLNFSSALHYSEYISALKFSGASISGGEPLLVSERSISYIKAIREFSGENLYIWLYTNGLLGNKKIFSELVNAGLQEVRFDIGATAYSTDFIKNASGIVPVITVEIPAIPEEKDNFIKTIPDLVKLGVKHINLHQLRLTEFNATKLLKRNYTYLHGEKITVLESEIAALEIMEYIATNNIEIGLNYCAFQFKNRYQKAGYRKKLANATIQPFESITAKGYIRRISVPKNELILSLLLSEKSFNEKWKIDGDKIIIHFDILKLVSDKIYMLEIDYYGAILENTENSLTRNTDYELLPGMFLSRERASDRIKLDKIDIQSFLKLILVEPLEPPSDFKLFEIWKMEYIEKGWRSYF